MTRFGEDGADLLEGGTVRVALSAGTHPELLALAFHFVSRSMTLSAATMKSLTKSTES